MIRIVYANMADKLFRVVLGWVFSSVGLPSEFSKRLVFEGWFKPCYVLWFVSFIINGKS